MLSKLAGLTRSQDMTVGTPWRNIVRFSLPLLIGSLVQQLYSTVDAIVVGNSVGHAALAAVGASGTVINLLLVLFIGVSTGASILSAQYYGARDRALLSKTIGTTITLTLAVSIFIMVVGTLITRPLLTLIQTPPDVYDGAVAYLTICFLGVIGIAYYNILAGILRGMGDAIMPLLFLCLACALNIVLDILFVAYLGWGVAGAAWATIFSQAVSAVLCFVRMLRLRDTVDVNVKTLRIDKPIALRLLRLGLPAGVTQMVFSMALLLVQSLINSFGSVLMACSTVVMRVDGFAMMPNFSFGSAMTTYTGQNVGARLQDRVEQGAKDGLKIGVGVSVVMTIGILLFGETLIRWLTQEAEVIRLGVRMLRILAVGYVAMSVTQVLGGIMRGAGDTLTSMWISIVTTFVIRTPLAYVLVALTKSESLPQGSPDGPYIALLVAWILGAILTAIFFRWGRWRRIAQARPEAHSIEEQTLQAASPEVP